MTKFEESMQEIFDIEPFNGNPNIDQDKRVTLLPANKSSVEPDMKQDLLDAYDQSKDNLQELIDNGREAMEQLLDIAKEGQHPRAYEVYGTLLKNMVDANKELLSIQKQMQDLTGQNQKTGDTKIDKAIFVGTAAELNKLLKDDS